MTTELMQFRMSGTGTCAKALFYEKTGKEGNPAPDWLTQAAEEGKWHETRIVKELLAQKDKVNCQQRELCYSDSEIELIGHIDGAIFNDINKPILLEVKSMSGDEFGYWARHKFDAFPYYYDQLVCYMTTGNFGSCRYIVKNRESGIKDTTDILYDIKMVDRFVQIVKKLTAVKTAVLENKAPDINYDPYNISCKRCFEYSNICMPSYKLPNFETLETATEMFREGNKIKDEGENLIEKAKAFFQQTLEDVPSKKLNYDRLSIQLVQYKGRISWNDEELAKVLSEEELMKCRSIGSDSIQLRVTDWAKREQNRLGKGKNNE